MSAAGERASRLSAAELARHFDESFARAAELERAATLDWLTLRLAGEHYAVRAKEVRAIVPTPRLTWLPSSHGALLGLAGIRGELVPVFDLERLLGYAGSSELPRWSLLVGSDDPVAFAFTVFERYQRVPSSNVSFLDAGAELGAFVKQVVMVGEDRLPVIGVLSLLEVIGDARGREKA